MSAKFPVFIVGSPRSGTSILVDGLLAAGYYGYREGNFLTLMDSVAQVVDAHRRSYGSSGGEVMLDHVDLTELQNDIYELLKTIVDRLNPDEPWFDKSGNAGMIKAIPALMEMWPSSVFVFAKRRGIENVISRLRKFPALDFEYHCRDWAHNMATWRKIRERIPTARFVEVDQRGISQQPLESAHAIGRILAISEYQIRHIYTTFLKNRPQETEAGSADRIYSLRDLTWTQAQHAVFDRHCLAEMRSYDYYLDESYWARPATA